MPRFEDGLSVSIPASPKAPSLTLKDLVIEVAELTQSVDSLSENLGLKLYGEGEGQQLTEGRVFDDSVYGILMHARSRLKSICENLDSLNDRTL